VQELWCPGGPSGARRSQLDTTCVMPTEAKTAFLRNQQLRMDQIKCQSGPVQLANAEAERFHLRDASTQEFNIIRYLFGIAYKLDDERLSVREF
jgi:hypothetical protein